MRGIAWFRRDLRLTDQPALTAACEACTEVIPLFVFDEPLLQSHVFGSACVNFMLGCLQELAASLAGRGIPLQWRRGEPAEEVVRAAREWKADAVYWNRDYEPGAIERDRAVRNDWRRWACWCGPLRTMSYSKRKKFGDLPESRCNGTVPIGPVGGRSGRQRSRRYCLFPAR